MRLRLLTNSLQNVLDETPNSCMAFLVPVGDTEDFSEQNIENEPRRRS